MPAESTTVHSPDLRRPPVAGPAAALRLRPRPAAGRFAMLAGAAWAATGLAGGGYLDDAAPYALLLGFIMSMVFAHARVILPAVLRVGLPYRPVLYVPVALLHAAVAVRVAGGLLAEIALLVFTGCAAVLVRRTRRASMGR